MAGGIGLGGRVAAVALAAVLLLAPAHAQDRKGDVPHPSGLPGAQIEALRGVAYSLAKKKREADVRELLGVLAQLGDDPATLEKLTGRCDRALALKRKGSDKIAKDVEKIAAAAEAFAGALEGVPDERREDIAAAILRLDGSHAAAHRVLGRVPHGDGFVDAELIPLLERRSEIELTFQKVRRFEVETSVGESKAAPLLDVYGEGGHSVRWRTLTIHSKTFSKERLKRVLEESVRAYALATYLRTGKLEAPAPQPTHYVVWSSREEHRRGLAAAVKKGGVSEEDAKSMLDRDGHNWIDARGYYVSNVYLEVHLECVLLRNLWMWRFHREHNAWADDDVQPCLLLGHLNWISERYLGGRIPGWDWYEDPERGRTSDEMSRERRRLLRLARSGVAGVRAYLKYLAAKQQDPAWARSFVKHAGELAGEDLLKSMLVVEYLQEQGRFREILLGTLKKPPTQKTFETALGMPLIDFENGWREWILAGEPPQSLVARMRGGPVDEGASGSADNAVRILNLLRAMTLPRGDPVELEPSLAKGCEGHARYLALNPDQAAAWPAAHEEYVDRPGYTPEGVRAAASSVIAPGQRTARGAIEAWMATFYHRLPLLDPGLMRIGWGLEDNVAVLDSASMVEPTQWPTLVVWPPHRGKDMPRRFAPELPSPKPGEDQSKWGYPITVQTFGAWENLGDLTVTLHVGDENGPEVPCIVSTPSEPSNPVLSPGGTWCLIPTAHLKSSTEYTIRIVGLPDEPKTRSTHTFSTGP